MQLGESSVFVLVDRGPRRIAQSSITLRQNEPSSMRHRYFAYQNTNMSIGRLKTAIRRSAGFIGSEPNLWEKPPSAHDAKPQCPLNFAGRRFFAFATQPAGRGPVAL
jgi:hypothetical protein